MSSDVIRPQTTLSGATPQQIAMYLAEHLTDKSGERTGQTRDSQMRSAQVTAGFTGCQFAIYK
jgi:hypothetical protein